MKKIKVVIPWQEGFHLRPASKLVHYASACRSSIKLKAHGKVADARSILGILLLCATFGTLLEVEISGEDETATATVVERIFEPSDDMLDNDTDRRRDTTYL